MLETAANEMAFLDYKELPEVSAVYEVWTDFECLYVGRSVNLHKRWSSHHMAIPCLRHGATIIRWNVASPENLESIEIQTIGLLHPRLNEGARYDSSIPNGWIPFNNEMIQLIIKGKFSAEEIRLLLSIAARMVPVTGLVHCSNAEYAKELGVSPNRVSRLIGVLVKARFVHRSGPKLVVVNPGWCFRGNPTEQQQALETWAKLHPIEVVSRQERRTA